MPAERRVAGGPSCIKASRRASGFLEEGSKQHVVHAPLNVKSWIAEPPSVTSIRPSCCPACGAASRPVGSALMLWGHGTRERTLWGLMTWDGAPTQITIRVQRYLCRACDVTCTVVPRGVAARYRYASTAITLAFWLWGVLDFSQSKVRAAISPWDIVGASQEGLWRSLRRWTRDVFLGRLFSGVALDASYAAGPARAIATRVAQIAAGRGPPDDRDADPRHRLWRGGEVMA